MFPGALDRNQGVGGEEFHESSLQVNKQSIWYRYSTDEETPLRWRGQGIPYIRCFSEMGTTTTIYRGRSDSTYACKMYGKNVSARYWYLQNIAVPCMFVPILDDDPSPWKKETTMKGIFANSTQSSNTLVRRTVTHVHLLYSLKILGNVGVSSFALPPVVVFRIRW